MQFYTPWAFLLLAIALPLTWVWQRRRGGRAPVRFSSLREAQAVRRSWRVRLRWLPGLARLICIVLLVAALARPREGSTVQRKSTKGVVLEVVVDRSGSMASEMQYEGETLTRLEVVKRVLDEFIRGGEALEGRANDLVGLITFALYSDTTCPLVHSHDALLGFLKQAKTVPERSPENRTAIGDAIALAAARLKKAEEEITRRNAKLTALASAEGGEAIKPDFEIQSKAIILLTDGQQNAGKYHPLEAAKLAQEWGITIYTIGIGWGQAYQRSQSVFGNFLRPTGMELDERLLTALAERTGGFYGRAGDGEALRRVVEKIDEQEKSEIESLEYSRYEERFGPWALAALGALILEIVLGCTVFRKIP